MYRPPFVIKPRINYSKTWAKLTRLFKQPASIQPDAAPVHLAEALAPQKIDRPQLKGNVAHTMKEILAIFLANWREAVKPINVAISTTRMSLAKRCQNRDPKTAYRHILTLIDYGFLRAKVHIRGGLQLLINPDLLIWDVAPAAVKAALTPNSSALESLLANTLEGGLAALQACAQNLAQNLQPGYLKNSKRA
ncbi:MAG: hypothetical protein EOO61_07310 [Hymenobacter sp.]|nr:MAG: hypothetical protein EOO61_07310 [Hymenobacter sp.]